ncbi:60S RIBOSOMAL PROTEIN L35A (L33) [Encephalitozoon cuniculi GB-M1]|uniref:60S RIBOSOMAL PROTEIN L35A (L33) n=2 Tax=Encephalitozoon cuniculi TaxID=6035 RepID=Q8SSF3_ENCCU|nr:60S ribosomal protein L33 [Encephalitozoon cuniculi GB-M1]7QEP_O3 Chain O3, 60S RIBOSOMAL PROTEIN L35A (L33) [Encephalitozoon cuniculi GB-M1]AGE95632.1 60S ribosomal protein l35a [Encephalitozoon cuniculi]KMV66608.1 ribosomal protein L35Ae [Encephalitozoon cuniculi EcunIII-L]UYI28283.1 ribosomal protein L33A [Encephalitozoon cuniculi]CAD25119.1 60S RIBOSOMAL PROTEIN L35A (L33) [Encephalitozoon cuniculi GB-M1]
MTGVMMNEEVLSRTTIPATFVSFKRGQRRLHPRHVLLKIRNVTSKDEASSYVGNGVVCYKKNNEGERYPVHGVITRIHGNSGAVRARFTRNLDPKLLGTHVFVKLYKVEADEI